MTIRRVDVVVCAVLALAIAVFFSWHNVTQAFVNGVSMADDAYFSLVAKGVITGQGYGLPLSSHEFSPFDPEIGSGPALILPLALAFALFGMPYWLPGLVVVVMFTAQMLLLVTILVRHFGAGNALGYWFAAMLALAISVSGYWLFANAMGEPTTCGFLWLAVVLLAVGRSTRSHVWAGICLSLALTTKQMAVFACAGIVVAWLAGQVVQDEPWRAIVRRVIALGSATALLPAAFEIIKLSTLGFDAYVGLVRSSVGSTAGLAVGRGVFQQRWLTFLSTLRDTYVPAALGIAIVVCAIGVLVYVTRRRGDDTRALRLSVMLLAGATAHFLYILFLSTLWTRYFFLGVALCAVAAATPVLIMGPRLRFVSVCAIAAANVWLGGFRPSLPFAPWRHPGPLIAENEQVLNMLSRYPSLPIAAERWYSLFDIVYLLGDNREWFQGAANDNLTGRRFIAIVHEPLTNKQSAFYQIVTARCRPEPPQLTVHHLYMCDETVASWRGWR